MIPKVSGFVRSFLETRFLVVDKMSELENLGVDFGGILKLYCDGCTLLKMY